MHCLTVEYPEPDDRTHFRSHYQARHLPVAEQLPGLIRLEVAYPQALNPRDEVPFCVFRAWFPDAQSMEAALFSEIGAELAADVPNYSPRGARMYHFAA